jgi:hypothetical protein
MMDVSLVERSTPGQAKLELLEMARTQNFN